MTFKVGDKVRSKKYPDSYGTVITKEDWKAGIGYKKLVRTPDEMLPESEVTYVLREDNRYVWYLGKSLELISSRPSRPYSRISILPVPLPPITEWEFDPNGQRPFRYRDAEIGVTYYAYPEHLKNAYGST